MRSLTTLLLCVALAGCATGPREVSPVDADVLFSDVPGLEFRPADQEIEQQLRQGLLEQVSTERLHEVAVARVAEDGREVAIGLVASFTAELDPGVVNGFISGALDGREPQERSTVELEDGRELTAFSVPRVDGALWHEAGVVLLIVAPQKGRAVPLARRIVTNADLPTEVPA